MGQENTGITTDDFTSDCMGTLDQLAWRLGQSGRADQVLLEQVQDLSRAILAKLDPPAAAGVQEFLRSPEHLGAGRTRREKIAVQRARVQRQQAQNRLLIAAVAAVVVIAAAVIVIILASSGQLGGGWNGR